MSSVLFGSGYPDWGLASQPHPVKILLSGNPRKAMAHKGLSCQIRLLLLLLLLLLFYLFFIIIIFIIISCHRFSFFPGTFPLEPVVNPTIQVSSLSL
jgi:hypothetical protein